MKEDKISNKLINVRPILISACALALGIVSSFYSASLSVWFTLIPAILLAVFFVATYFIKDELRKKIFTFLLIFFLFFTLGHALVDIRINEVKKLSFNTSENEIFAGRVCDVTYYDSYTYVEFDNCSFRGFKLKGKTSAYIYNGELVDKIDIGSLVKCEANLINRYKSEGMKADLLGGLYYQLENVDDISVTGYKTNFYELAYLNVRSFLRQNLSKDGYSMAIALVLGNTSYLPSKILESYRLSGIAHVFAVSGLHIGIFVSIFTFFASKLKINRKIQPLFILIPTFIYCGICGFKASSVRAFIMACVTIIANSVGFKKDNISSSSLAGIILLIINPMGLFDAGFKLSFLAVNSIFILNPVFERGAKALKGVGSAISVSLSAQLATLPVLTDISGYISIISVFANLVFVPVVVVLYVVTLLFVAISASVGIVFSNAPSLILSIPDFLLNACNFLIQKIDFSMFVIPANFSYFKIGWYLGLICLSDLINLKWQQKLLISLITLLVTIVGIILVALI